jgi:hypothetical protein
MHSDPKFGRRGGGVSYIDARGKRFQNAILACVVLRKNFQNSFPAHSIPLCTMQYDVICLAVLKVYKSVPKFLIS